MAGTTKARKIAARLSIGALVAGLLAGLTTSPAYADAGTVRSTDVVLQSSAAAALAPMTGSGCKEWQLPLDTELYQDNGWSGAFWYNSDEKHWRAHLYDYGYRSWIRGGGGSVFFSSATGDSVKFTIAWKNGSGGIYEGRIDDNGWVSGRASDRWNNAQTNWRLRDTATCSRQ